MLLHLGMPCSSISLDGNLTPKADLPIFQPKKENQDGVSF